MLAFVAFYIEWELRTFRRMIQKASYFIQEQFVERYKQRTFATLMNTWPELIDNEEDEYRRLQTLLENDVNFFIRHCQKFISLLQEAHTYNEAQQLKVFDLCYRFKLTCSQKGLGCCTFPGLIQEIMAFDLDNIIVPADQSIPMQTLFIYSLEKKHLFFQENSVVLSLVHTFQF